MDDIRMQQVAAEVGFSETAFLTHDGGLGERRSQIRYFSPVAEVGFCGHATIATAVQDIDKAVFYPDDEQFLVERDLTVRHYEVGGTQEAAQVSSRPLSSGRTHRASDPRYWPHG